MKACLPSSLNYFHKQPQNTPSHPFTTASAAKPKMPSTTTTTTTTKAKVPSPSSAAFLDAIKSRRTFYALTNKSPIPDSRIQEIVNQAVLHVPSAFNSQSTRVLILLKAEHEALWDITTDVLKAIVPAEQFASTQQRMDSFRAGYGTVSLPPDTPLSFYIYSSQLKVTE